MNEIKMEEWTISKMGREASHSRGPSHKGFTSPSAVCIFSVAADWNNYQCTWQFI